MQKTKIQPPQTKIYSKWIKDPNIRPEVIKILKESIGEILQDIGICNDFTDKTPKAQAAKPELDK